MPPWSAGRWARSASSAAASCTIDYDKRARSPSASTVLKEGDFISIDGFTGEVMAGQVATKPSEVVQVLIEKTLEARAVARSTSSSPS